MKTTIIATFSVWLAVAFVSGLPKEDPRQGGTMVVPKRLLGVSRQGGIMVEPKAIKCKKIKLVVDDEVTITSPRFPKFYPNKACYRWDLESKDSLANLQLDCPNFKLRNSKNCRGDRLTLTDGESPKTKLCGKKDHPTFETNSNTIIAEFKTNGRQRSQGFKCTVRSLQAATSDWESGTDDTSQDTTKAPTPKPTTKAPTPKPSGGGTCKCGVANPTRIVGGTLVSPAHKYPWHVGLKMKTHRNFWCGGAIISSQFVITAAHCFFDQDGNRNSDVGLVVGIGDHDMYDKSDDVSGATRLVSVKKVILHENYKASGYDYDMALLRLEESLDLTKYKEVRSVCLPWMSTKTYTGVTGYAYGWGNLNSGGSQPAKLMEVQLPILEQSCWNVMSGITERMMCAGYKAGGKDTCQGDSGGPFTVIENNKHIQVGVVSWGAGCANANSPGVYSRVTKFLDWIKKNAEGATFCD